MRKENLFLLTLFIIAILIVFYPSAGWMMRSFLAPAIVQNKNATDLALENGSLKAELANLRAFKKENSPSPENFLQASVYSNYPFNFKSELLADKGGKDGVKTGQPVVVLFSSGKVVVGKIKEVFGNNSLIQTIFDSRFQTSVRIGEYGVNSLLKGGNNPKLTLIPKDAKIGEGDAVYSVSPDYPFGMAVGLAKNIHLSPDQFFSEADLETAYNPNDFQSVFIDTAYNNVKGTQQ